MVCQLLGALRGKRFVFRLDMVLIITADARKHRQCVLRVHLESAQLRVCIYSYMYVDVVLSIAQQYVRVCVCVCADELTIRQHLLKRKVQKQVHATNGIVCPM